MPAVGAAPVNLAAPGPWPGLRDTTAANLDAGLDRDAAPEPPLRTP